VSKTVLTLRILLVEDDLQWQKIILPGLLNQALSEINQEGEIKSFAYGAEARKAIDSDPPWHLIIVDLGLPDEPAYEDDTEIGRNLIHYAGQKQIPVVVVTGQGTATDGFFLSRTEEKVIDIFEKQGFTYRRQSFIEQVKKVLLDQVKNPVTPRPGRSLENAHALIIGVAKYNHLRHLSKTVVDAQDLYKTLLQNGYIESNVFVLLDQKATKNAIDDRLNWLSGRVKADDTVVIFFSGHGAQMVGGFSPGEYLCPIEAEPGRLKDTCISHDEFTTALRAIHARRLVVLLDACHSGGIGEPKDFDVQVKTGLSETAYTHFAEVGGRFIIASCRPDEFSWELANMQNGLFTHYLLEGIRGKAANKDGLVRITNLFGYIYENVSQHSPDCPQHPFIKSSGEDFIIAIANSSS
jgi:CheY-like chemotaxis protein